MVLIVVVAKGRKHRQAGEVFFKQIGHFLMRFHELLVPLLDLVWSQPFIFLEIHSDLMTN
jgi:hypothetical protein